VVDIVRSDDGGADPRHAGSGPQVFSADTLPVIKKAPVVPVVISASGAVQVGEEAAKPAKAKAAPKAKKAGKK
jgi:hypothetical protein